MNLREGTRRLALLLGSVGAIFGGFASYMELQTTLSQRAQHNKFEQLAASDAAKQERKCRLLGYYSGCSQLPPLPQGYILDKPKYTVEEPDGKPAASELSKGDIKTIHWTKKYEVELLETEDGQTLFPTSSPSTWTYLFIALFPVFGFLIPWGAIRGIGWAVAGFVQPFR